MTDCQCAVDVCVIAAIAAMIAATAAVLQLLHQLQSTC
jgi:hypothetical protein